MNKSKQITLTAIVIKSSEYGEFDKNLTLFSHEGKTVRAKIRGVKKEKAKLKFAAQPFAFCEFELAEKNDFLTVTGATQIEDISNIVHDYDAFALSALMFECTTIAVSHAPIPELFPLLLNCFRHILYKNICPFTIACFYIDNILILEGYQKDSNKTIETLFEQDKSDFKKTINFFETTYNIKLKTKINH
ncbi:MAG: DNA repair protein RecO [Firmicutes bacterium]|nr:DNA repair protein RecO [Bacillota bacterium]